MASSNISDPGYGWTTIKRKELVVLEEGGRAVTDLDVIEGFPTNFPAEFIRKFCLNSGISCRLNSQKFSMAINDVLRSYFSSSPFEEEYIEFQSSGRSNGRQMKWDIMNIQPNTSFRLHAHPNIEIIYVIQGAIHEYRYEGPQPKKYSSPTDVMGPDMSAGVQGTFNHRYTRAGKNAHTAFAADDNDHLQSCNDEPDRTAFLVNEKGSIHQSFTAEDGAVLLILWSGCHANVPRPFHPPKGTIPDLPVGVEPMHKDDDESGI